MKHYTHEMFTSGYKAYADDWVEKFMRDAYDYAQFNTDSLSFTKKMYGTKKVIDKTLEVLQNHFGSEFKISMSNLQEQENDRFYVDFTIRWD